MPELPEVETVLRGLLQSGLGRRIARVEVNHSGVIPGNAKTFAAGIEGRPDRFHLAQRQSSGGGACRPGKRPPHLSGDAPWHDGPDHRAALRGPAGTAHPRRMQFEDGKKELRFRDARRFGRLRCLTRQELEELLQSLGPDARRMTEDDFLVAMRGRRGAIKSWLMNQQMLAGLGNIYADEALFEARIHPLAQPGRIPAAAARRLYRAVQKVLKKAIELQGTSFRDYIDIEGPSRKLSAKTARLSEERASPARAAGPRFGAWSSPGAAAISARTASAGRGRWPRCAGHKSPPASAPGSRERPRPPSKAASIRKPVLL